MKLQRVEPVDALFRPEGAVLLYERTLIRLTPLGEETFHLAEQPVTLDEIASHLLAAFGAPEGDLNALVEAVVQQLTSEGVLEEIE